ncbi:MAG TPA: hypothetical protein VKK79_02520 [Candidatus Lokiarchaeia archaeon]|nr:hypothetical protein [Candidatus Lokiarchaeia archaeon]
MGSHYLDPKVREFIDDFIKNLEKRINEDANYVPPTSKEICALCKKKTGIGVSGLTVLRRIKKLLGHEFYQDHFTSGKTRSTPRTKAELWLNKRIVNIKKNLEKDTLKVI